MRKLLLLLLMTVSAQAATTFVAPLDGAQAIGPMTVEITTDAQNVDRVDFFVDDVFAGVAHAAPYRIRYDFGDTLTSRRVRAKVWTNSFKSFETVAVTTVGVTVNDLLNVELVELPVKVRATRPLRVADIRVLENGVEQTVRDVKQERAPAHFAFVVDRSLSMNGGKLEAALKAVQAGLAQLRGGDTASLILFNHQVAKARPIQAGDTLSTTDLSPSGGTSLRDALASAASKERTYAFVITDGGDRNSELSDDAALQKISGTRTIVNALVLGNSHATFLDKAAGNTGGRVTPTDKATVGSELTRLLEDINSRHLIIYQSNGTDRGWRIAMVKTKYRDVIVSNARKEYFAE